MEEGAKESSDAIVLKNTLPYSIAFKVSSSFTEAGHGCSVGCGSTWYADGRGFLVSGNIWRYVIATVFQSYNGGKLT